MSVPPYRTLLPEGGFLLEEVQLRAEPGYPQEIESCDLQCLACQVLLHHMTSLCPREGRAGGPKQGHHYLFSQARLPNVIIPVTPRAHQSRSPGDTGRAVPADVMVSGKYWVTRCQPISCPPHRYVTSVSQESD